jgi:hypothetical protein
MMTIIEFLEARIAEDEAQAEYVYEYGSSSPAALFAPARVLAECAAKRAIIEQAEEATGLDMSVDNDRRVGSRDMDAEPYCGDVILSALAALYKDHPDYRQEWAA